MATRIWDSSYQDLLELVNLPTLEHRRLETRLCLIHKLCYFEDNIFTTSTSLSHHAPHNLILNQLLLTLIPIFILLFLKLYLIGINLTPLLLPVLHSQPLSITYHDIVLCLHSCSLLSTQGHVLTLALVAIHMHPLPTFWHKYYRKRRKKCFESLVYFVWDSPLNEKACSTKSPLMVAMFRTFDTTFIHVHVHDDIIYPGWSKFKPYE